MAKNGNRGGSSRGSSNNSSDSWSGGMMDLARERPIAAAAVAAGAAAAGLFLWSKRSQISQQISDLSDQIGDWTENMGSGSDSSMDDTGGLTTSQQSGMRSGAGSRSASGTRSRSSTATRNRGMSETGGGNASLGAHSGGIGTSTTGSPSGRGTAATDNS